MLLKSWREISSKSSSTSKILKIDVLTWTFEEGSNAIGNLSKWDTAFLTLIAIYTFAKKNFGASQEKNLTPNKQLFLAVVMSLCIGFYDGFIGPGTGSLLVLGFVAILGFDFLHASANAKMVNLATNFGSICLF